MTPALRNVLRHALGADVESTRRLSGGDINDAFEVALSDGCRVFVKTHPSPPLGMFTAEARGLEWLDEAQALRIPRVLAVSDAPPAFLALELLTPGKRQKDFDAVLGCSLASLHRFGAPCFGLDHDNFIGRLAQSNRPTDDWAAFYWSRRLEPQLRLGADRGLIRGSLLRRFSNLEGALGGLVATEAPSRLHGDLWGGNLHVDESGAPCLIDPAAYGGHREIDLAMMRLFGGFGARVFDAYHEVYPLPPGAEERVSLYQLYPLLVHVNLFGGSYLSSVERALGGCGS
jgi:fructosamine-3-kinase